MATIKFLLQKPYKERKTQTAKGGVSTEKSPSKKTVRPLNPLETRLYLVLIVDHDHVVRVKTEHKIYPEQWDFKTQLKKGVKGNAAGTTELNKEIEEFNEGLQKLKKDTLEEYRKMVKQFPDMPFSHVAQILKDYGKNKEIPFSDNDKDFLQRLDEYISTMEGELTAGTLKKFVTLKNSLIEFGKQNKKYAKLSFSMIDEGFRSSYVKYLRSQKPRGRQKTRPEDDQNGLLTDTVGKYIESVKTFCKWAERNKYHTNKEYLDLPIFTKADKKRKKQDSDIVTMTLAELKQFYNYKFTEDSTFDHVRDLFCFEAFTGQRWGDVIKFDERELQGNVWVLTNQKTNKEVSIDLVGYAAPALEILKKYNFELPVISNQKFNLYIKKAGEEAEINTPVRLTRYVGIKQIILEGPKYEFLHSHVARATCVSILLNNFNINPIHVMEITNHSDLKTLQKYIKKDRNARKEAISKTKSINEPLTIVKQKAG
jgi:integrase